MGRQTQNLQACNDQAKADGVAVHAGIYTAANGNAYIIDGVRIGTTAHDPEGIVGKIVPVICWVIGIALQGTAGELPDITTHV